MPTQKDLVSVIIPSHNRARYLPQAIASVLHQTYTNLEIIVVANGCTDHTAEIIGGLKQDHSQTITHLEFGETLGGARARNIGMQHANGEYIAFLDDDDTWHADKLRAQVARLQRDQYAIVGCNHVYVYGRQDNQRPAKPVAAQRINIADLHYENTLGNFSGCITKKAYLGANRINEQLDALQDWDLWLKILHNAKLPAYIEQAHLVYIRIGGNGISQGYPQVIAAQRIFLNAWQHLFDHADIDYHRMRTNCLILKTRKQKYRRYCAAAVGIVRAIFDSRYRYNLKRYLHYLALPLIDIDATRIWLWSKFRWR